MGFRTKESKAWGQIQNNFERNLTALVCSINMTSDLTLHGMYLDASIASKLVNLTLTTLPQKQELRQCVDCTTASIIWSAMLKKSSILTINLIKMSSVFPRQKKIRQSPIKVSIQMTYMMCNLLRKTANQINNTIGCLEVMYKHIKSIVLIDP